MSGCFGQPFPGFRIACDQARYIVGLWRQVAADINRLGAQFARYVYCCFTVVACDYAQAVRKLRYETPMQIADKITARQCYR